MNWNDPQHPSRQGDWGPGVTAPPPDPSTGPRWARKRVILPAAGVLFLLGIGIGATGDEPEAVRTAAVKAEPGPTVTVTVTETAKVTVTASPEPAPTVTKIKKVRVTVTAPPPEPAAEAPDAVYDEDDDSGGGSTYYKNCTAVRAAGAAPHPRGAPRDAGHPARRGGRVGGA
ncbi:excalibur calcium-binding domain-containing protein, partial [Streptomyces cyaneofuscatus]|uniref:excalibur calcium-binding domain-containing protein n=1 Tax=Streptomyces cyaneofuscatus TaxID=66883 RepID=UPI00369B694C